MATRKVRAVKKGTSKNPIRGRLRIKSANKKRIGSRYT